MNGAENTPSSSTHEGAPRPKEEAGLDEAAFASLLGGLDAASPLLRSLGGVLGAKPSPACTAREHLLLSLKPYLSPARCEAVDYLVRVARLGDIIRSLEKGEGRP